MLKIYPIEEKQEYLREVSELTQKEWGSKTNSEKEFQEKIVGIYFNKKWNDSKTHTYVRLEIADLFTYPIHKFVRSQIKDLSFFTIEKKLDKGIKKGIKIFP